LEDLEMVKLAIVGCGGMAQGHAQTLASMPDVKLVGFCDIVKSRAEAYREKYAKDAQVFESHTEMIKALRGKLDGVVNVTPHTVHYPQCKESLEAGLHVLVEKPMVTNSNHAYDLWKTVNASGKVFAIAFQAPYTAEYQCIQKLRGDGTLGKVQLIQGWLAQNWKNNTVGTWRQDPAMSGGGQMYDSGAHVLNSIMWIMNEPVVEVACMYDKLGTPVDINGVIMMKFQSGTMGTVCIGGNSPGWDVEVRVQSDTMQLRTGPHGGWLEGAREGRKFYPPVAFDNSPGAFTPHKNFVNAILGKEKVIAPVRYGVLLSALMDAMYESAEKGMPVKVKPVPERLD
jgi:predicted dehydrogenase